MGEQHPYFAPMDTASTDPKMGSATPPALGHSMSPTDPDNPQNWPIAKKIYASSVSAAFTFAVAFGLTSTTVGIQGVMMRFDVSMTVAILPLSLFLFGVFFAPIITPHLSERLGRSPVYFVSLPLFALFILGAGLSKSFASLAICRFFAGFFGGPCLVLIEGTFADVWPAQKTVTYYSFLSLASYIGAGSAPLILGYVLKTEDWRWTQFVTLMFALAAFLLGVGLPETYPREILRSRARRLGHNIKLAKAESGVTLSEMAQTTLFTPLAMAVSEPVVIMVTLYLALNFAVLFQWFISVPAVLHLVYGFTLQQGGLAFISAIGGALVSMVTSSLLEAVSSRKSHQGDMSAMAPIENRLVPAMVGSLGMVASLFWIGWTAKPEVHSLSPIIGTGLYVWSSMSILTALVSYIFDAYPPRGTLSALTLMACVRIICAGWLPLVIIQMIMNVTGRWTFSIFGFIAAGLVVVPFILYRFGPSLRARSRHSGSMMAGGNRKMEHQIDEEMRTGVGSRHSP